MSWFKTDDKLPDHRKTRAVRKSHPTKRRDSAPFGLWVQAGAWSSDGFVPLEILEDWDDDALELAGRLVDAGMWHPTRRDGEPGYVFHDWHDQNPAKDDNDPSSAGTFGNHVRWHVQRRQVDETCRHCPKEPDAADVDRPDDRPDIAPIIGGDIAYDRAESLPSRPVLTRPDPTRTETPLSDKSDDTKPNRFDEWWETYSRKVGKPKARTAYRAALRKPGVTDELLIAAAAAFITWQIADGKHPTYTPHPTTWLQQERWTDERPARAPGVTSSSNMQAHMRLVEQTAREYGDGLPLELGPAS